MQDRNSELPNLFRLTIFPALFASIPGTSRMNTRARARILCCALLGPTVSQTPLTISASVNSRDTAGSALEFLLQEIERVALANLIELAEEALHYFSALYEIESLAREQKLDAQGRLKLRQQRSKPIAEALRQWLTRQRGQVPDGSATAKAIEYSLGRWAALIRYLEDGDLPIDNNHVENRIRPIAVERSLCTS